MKWFKHDTDATADAKIRKLIIKHGPIGYAVYFHCLELIAGEVSDSNITFELEHDSEIIADNLKVSGTAEKSGVEIVEDVMRYIIAIGLFEQSGEKITCFKLIKRLDSSMSSNQKFRSFVAKTRANHDSVMTESTDSHDPVMNKTRQDKTRKEKSERDAGDKSPAPARHKFGKFKNVLLTDEERSRLYADFPNASEAIEHLSEYKEMRGMKYKNDNLVLRKWVFLALRESALKTATLEAKERQAAGFEEFKPSPLPAFSRTMVPEAPTEEEAAQIDIEELASFRRGSA